jgi:hypothetical protein
MLIFGPVVVGFQICRFIPPTPPTISSVIERQGYNAFWSGESSLANPYDWEHDPFRNHEWSKGFDEARDYKWRIDADADKRQGKGGAQ